MKSKIPPLRYLVGSYYIHATTKNDIKSELVILITPRVVKGKQDSRVISNEFKRKLTSIYKEEISDGINNLGAEEQSIQQLNP